MRGTVLHGPGDVRFEERPAPAIHNADRCDRKDVGDVCLRVRPVALPRRQPDHASRRRWGTSTAASSRRSAVR